VLAPNPGPFTLEGTNTWIVGSGRTLVIDPGPLDPGHIEATREEAGEIAAILLTHHHPDHAPAAATLSALTGAAVFAFRPEAEESKIADGDVVDGLQAVHTPGHTADHLAFFHPSSGAMFTGDAVLGRGTSVIDPPEGDMAAYSMSLRRMLELRPALIHPGHGPSVASAEAKLREYIEHREQRERQVLERLGRGPKTPQELVPLIYEAYPADLHGAAARSVLAHLIKLEREGRVIRLPTTDVDRFELTAASD
jgi:glyoxylase-like metal-dependent hydrolase (beta-lactamase superfamily II)